MALSGPLKYEFAITSFDLLSYSLDDTVEQTTQNMKNYL